MKEMLELSEHVVMLVSCDASDASSPSRLITSGSCKRSSLLGINVNTMGDNAEDFITRDETAMNISHTAFFRVQDLYCSKIAIPRHY